jgi:hypothetical protein
MSTNEMPAAIEILRALEDGFVGFLRSDNDSTFARYPFTMIPMDHALAMICTARGGTDPAATLRDLQTIAGVL